MLATVFLFTLAIAQPVLDLVGRNPEFLVAHDTSPAGVVGMAVLLAVGLPLAIGLMVAAIRKVLPRLGTALHVTVISVLMGLLLMRMAKAIEVLPDLIVVALALLLGVVGGVAITYVQAARQAAAWGAAASVLAVGMFLIATPARSLLQSYDHEAVPALGVPEGDLPPVVMVVFDEFALTSLLDPAGELDTALYPSFGRLARDATFYRNTVAVHSNTTQVIPAMLTAQHVPSGPALPTAVKHPVNAFSILAPSYDIRVTEPVTSLCPSDVCDSPAGSGAAASTMVVDVWFIALHVLLPDGFTRSLPPVDQGWGDFAAEPTQEDLAKRFAVASRKHRGKTFMSAVRAIEPASDRPTFDFVHTLLPHVPWDFLSTGQTYGAPRTVFGMGENKAWGTNDWLVQQAHQRYMLQVGYVDRLVGALIDELEREGVYNETLLIVTADHGVSFVPGFSRRHFLPETVGGSAWFPLFVKLPQQRDGGTDDRPLTSIDVLPTIIAAIGGDLGEYDFEGVEAGQVTTERRDRTVPGSPSWPEFDEAKRDATLARQAQIFPGFPGRTTPWSLVPAPEHRQLLDRRVGNAAAHPTLEVKVEPPWPSSRVDLSRPVIPAQVRGTILGIDDADPPVIAVAVNGAVEAVTESWLTPEGEVAFSAMLRPESLRSERSELEAFLVTPSGELGDSLPVTGD